MKKILLSFTSLTFLMSTHVMASGSPQLQCWIKDLPVKKWIPRKGLVNTSRKVGLFLGGLDKMEEVENPTHYPISDEIMIQITGEKPATPPRNGMNYLYDLHDAIDLIPVTLGKTYGKYEFADKDGKDLPETTVDFDFVSNSGSEVSIHAKSKKPYGDMKGTATIKISHHDSMRIMRAVTNIDGNLDLDYGYGPYKEDGTRTGPKTEYTADCEFSY